MVARTIGQRAKELRLEKGLRQVDVCEIAGLSINTVWRFENDYANGSPREFFFRDTINKIMDALGVTLDEFMRGVIIG